MIMRFLPLLALLLTPAPTASTSSVLGLWRSPDGGVIKVFNCGPDICARLVGLAPEDLRRLDSNNPDKTARTHPLCGLQIGYAFHLIDPAHADSGRLYDPKSGKTYHGDMTADGDHLHLRGYVGIKAFGRTEVWTRVTPGSATCPAKPAA